MKKIPVLFFSLLSFFYILGAKEEAVKITIPVIPSSGKIISEIPDISTLRLTINNADREISGLKRGERSLGIKPDLGRMRKTSLYKKIFNNLSSYSGGAFFQSSDIEKGLKGIKDHKFISYELQFPFNGREEENGIFRECRDQINYCKLYMKNIFN